MITPIYPSNNPYPPINNGGVNNYQPVSNYPYNPYQPDMYSTNSIQTNGTSSYPLNAIIEDMTVSKRYSMFFINNSSRLLTMGSNSIGRFCLNLLAGNIPFITCGDKAQMISNNVYRWVGRADLLRVGASPFHTFLLQDAGVMNVTDLARITNPLDQSILVQRLQMAAANRGSTDFPTLPMVQNWVQIAQTLPKKL